VNDTQGAEQTPVAPLTPERLAQYTRAAQDAVDWYKRGDCALSIQARDLLALCRLAAWGLQVIAAEDMMARLGADGDDAAQGKAET
jgi:hypothetical protein